MSTTECKFISINRGRVYLCAQNRYKGDIKVRACADRIRRTGVIDRIGIISNCCRSWGYRSIKLQCTDSNTRSALPCASEECNRERIEICARRNKVAEDTTAQVYRSRFKLKLVATRVSDRKFRIRIQNRL